MFIVTWKIYHVYGFLHNKNRAALDISTQPMIYCKFTDGIHENIALRCFYMSHDI